MEKLESGLFFGTCRLGYTNNTRFVPVFMLPNNIGTMLYKPEEYKDKNIDKLEF